MESRNDEAATLAHSGVGGGLGGGRSTAVKPRHQRMLLGHIYLRYSPLHRLRIEDLATGGPPQDSET